MLRSAYSARAFLEPTEEHRGFTPRTDDWVAGELWLPPGAAPAFREQFTLWRAVDARGDHPRAPQKTGGVTGLELLLALPRADELTVEEMADLVRAFCRRFVDEKLAVQWDIHAPQSPSGSAGDEGRPIAVHAHILVSGRPIRGDSVLPGRTRLFDPVMRPGYRRAIGWSREWRVAQELFFAERGIPLAVAVPSGVGERSLGRSRFRPEARARLAAMRARRRADLRHPAAIIGALLRDRCAFDRADLDALVRSLSPSQPASEPSVDATRATLAEAVLRDPSLRPGRTVDGVPCWTTAEWAGRVARAIAHAARSRPAAPPDPEEGEDWDPDDPAAPWPDEPAPSRWPGILAGETLAQAVRRIAEGQRAAGGVVMIAAPTALAYGRMATMRAAGFPLCAVQTLARAGSSPREGATLIVPFAEMLTDPELASALECAAASGASLLLLRDPAQPDRLRPSLLAELQGLGLLAAGGTTPLPAADPATPQARPASLDDDALMAIAADAQAEKRPIVATGPALVARLNAAMRERRIRLGAIDAARHVTVAGLPLAPGDRIVVVSAWDRQIPPRRAPALRAGDFWSVVGVDVEASAIQMRKADGETLTLSDRTGAGTLAYGDAVTLRTAIGAGVADATLILDEPRTMHRALALQRTGGDGALVVTPDVAACWHTEGAGRVWPIPTFRDATDAVGRASTPQGYGENPDDTPSPIPDPTDEDVEPDDDPAAAADDLDEPVDPDDLDAMPIIDGDDDRGHDGDDDGFDPYEDEPP